MKEVHRIDSEENDLLYDDINFEGIDDDLAAFQEDEMVQQALHRGVDLKKYGEELERDLKQVGNRRFFVTLSLFFVVSIAVDVRLCSIHNLITRLVALCVFVCFYFFLFFFINLFIFSLLNNF